jgi:hypothetical protein
MYFPPIGSIIPSFSYSVPAAFTLYQAFLILAKVPCGLLGGRNVSSIIAAVARLPWTTLNLDSMTSSLTIL